MCPVLKHSMYERAKTRTWLFDSASFRSRSSIHDVTMIDIRHRLDALNSWTELPIILASKVKFSKLKDVAMR